MDEQPPVILYLPATIGILAAIGGIRLTAMASQRLGERFDPHEAASFTGFTAGGRSSPGTTSRWQGASRTTAYGGGPARGERGGVRVIGTAYPWPRVRDGDPMRPRSRAPALRGR
ncbi:hypothetical protein ACFQQB_62955 [Nonomuraea rubra]|uniref:hypothetical protein n=1 Tax=Nonomuraea rubra TaxID=46180 RepID=UPI00360FD676